MTKQTRQRRIKALRTAVEAIIKEEQSDELDEIWMKLDRIKYDLIQEAYDNGDYEEGLVDGELIKL